MIVRTCDENCMAAVPWVSPGPTTEVLAKINEKQHAEDGS